MMGPPMLLLDFVNQKYRRRHLNLGDKALHQLCVVVRLLEKSMARTVHTTELSSDLVFEFAAWLKDNGRAARTISGRVASLLTIWREARRCKLAPDLPENEDLPTIAVPKRVPRAWEMSDFERLVRAAAEAKGNMKGTQIPARVWWTSMFLFMFDTGTRRGAALAVKPADIDLRKRLVRLEVESAKTKVEQYVAISAQTCSWIEELLKHRFDQAWPLQMCESSLYYQFKKILRAAGLPEDRRNLFHKIRRTNATYTAVCGSLDQAQQSLGHESPRMTLQSYIDPTIYRPTSPADILPRPDFGAQSA